MHQQNENKKKMKTWQKVTLIVVLSVVAVLLIAAIGLYALFNHYYNKTNYVPLGSEEVDFNITFESEETWPPEYLTTEEPDTGSSTTPNTGSATTPNTGIATTPNTGIATTPNTGIATTPNTDKVTTPGTTTTPTTTTEEKPIVVTPSFEITPPKAFYGDHQEYKENTVLANALNNYRMSFGSHIKNILLIGTDGATPSARGRSDSIILVTINETPGQIMLTSILRDIFVYIPGAPDNKCFDRINAAYAYGGVTMLVNTIEANFKIKIDKYARVNFTAFTDIVNTMGGIEMNLSQKEIDYLVKYAKMDASTKPGLVRLNGKEALEYCRCRKVGIVDPATGKPVTDDFSRTLRQRLFLSAVFERVKTLNISEVNELLETYLPYITHNFTQSEILGYVAKFPQYIGYKFTTRHLLSQGGVWNYDQIDKKSIVTVKYQKVWEYLEKCINGTA